MERRNVRERWPVSYWKGGCSVCRGTVRGGCQWLGLSKLFKLVGQGGLPKKAQNVQEDNICKGIQGNTSKEEI